MRFTVGIKLYSLVIVILILMGIVGGVGINSMNTMNSKTQEITEKAMVGVESMDNINYLAMRVRARELQTLLEPNPTNKQAYIADIQTCIDNMNKSFTQYQATITTNQDRQDYNALVSAWNQYQTYNSQFIELSKNVNIVKGAGKEAPQVLNLMNKSYADFVNIKKFLSVETTLNNNFAAQSAKASTSSFITGRTVSIVIMIVALLLSIALAHIIVRGITKPLKDMEQVAEGIASGDLTMDTIRVKSKDEIGILAHTFNQMVSHLRSLIQQVTMNSQQVAAASEELTASAEQTSQATQSVAITIQEMAVGAEQQATHAEETSHSITEMAEAVQQIAGNAQSVSTSADQALEVASDGLHSIQQAVQQMNSINTRVHDLAESTKELGTSSDEIDQIVHVITDIAAQTNLLSLNAAIEAARAGEAGRGFAVVADEVRKLAEQSANSAQQIQTLIARIQSNIGSAIEGTEIAAEEARSGIEVVTRAGDSFDRINNAIHDVSSQIQEVSASAQQISAGTEQVVQSMGVVSEIAATGADSTQSVSAATEEQMASMEEIAASATTLSQMAEQLQELVGKFKV